MTTSTSPSTLAARSIAAAREQATRENRDLVEWTSTLDSRDLARVAGVSRSMIYRWRDGTKNLAPVRLQMIRDYVKTLVAANEAPRQ